MTIKKNKIFQWAITLLVPLALYWFILINRYPYPLRPLSMAVRYSLTFVLPSLFIFFFLLFLSRDWWGRLLQLSGTLAIFGLALAGLWAKGESEYYIISGLIPFVDASSYLNEARRLLEGLQFTDFSAWRPVFPAFLAPILALAKQNLQVTLAAIVFVAAISCLLLSLEIRRTHGPLAAAFVMTVLFLYYRRFSGAVIPENLGLSLGCLGYALLWRGSSNKIKKTLFLGVFFTTLALFCRLGAFFVVPLLVFWCGRLYRQKKWISWKAAGWSSGAAISAFLFYLAASFIFSASPKLPTSYYSTVFYDLASGYPTKFGQVYEDHPEIIELSENQQTKEVYRLAFERIKEQPSVLLQGAKSQIQLFFSYTWYAVYGFLIAGSQTVTMILYIGMYLLCAAGIGAWFFHRADERLSLTLLTVLGILLSVPFVPPQLHNRIRMYAASIPALVILPGLGFYYLTLTINKFARLKILSRSFHEDFPAGTSTWFGYAIIAVIILGNAGIFLLRQPAQYTEIECKPDQEAVYIQYTSGSQINIIPEHIFMIDWLPNFHNGKFRWYLHSTPHYEAISEMENIVHPPSTIFNAMDLKSGKDLILVADSNIYPQTPALLGVCGTWRNEPEVAPYHLFYGETITTLSTE